MKLIKNRGAGGYVSGYPSSTHLFSSSSGSSPKLFCKMVQFETIWARWDLKIWTTFGKVWGEMKRHHCPLRAHSHPFEFYPGEWRWSRAMATVVYCDVTAALMLWVTNNITAKIRVYHVTCLLRIINKILIINYYYTLCPKKVVHLTLGDNFVNILNGFSKFFHCWKET